MKGKLPAYIAFGLITLHLTLSFMYTAPETYRVQVLHQVSQSYVFPFMPQNWTLFAPEVPKDNYEVHVSLDGKEFELMEELLSRSHLGLLSIDHSLSVGLYNYCYYLDHELKLNRDDYYRRHLDGVVTRTAEILPGQSAFDRLEYTVYRNGELIYFKRIENFN